MPRIVIENLFNREINFEAIDRKVIELIHENNIDFEWLPFLGRVRNDWSANNNPFDANNFHIC